MAPSDRFSSDSFLLLASGTGMFLAGTEFFGEDRKFVVNANSGVLLRSEEYVDRPFINRLHSGEAFGDGGLVAAMFWALALMALTISGLAIIWRVRRTDLTGWRRYSF